MTEQHIALLAIQLFASLSVLAYLGVMLLKKREERERFRLYAIRDRLLYLVATGKLPEKSLVFKVFYRAINVSINEARRLTVSSLIRASANAKSTLEQEERDRLLESIKRASPEVREVVDEFTMTMIDIVFSNSISLRLFVHCARVVKVLADGVVTPPKPRGYETYVYWRDMKECLA